MTEKYQSKQARIRKPAQTIYAALSDFNNFTPIVADKVEEWRVEGDSCSFRVKGIGVELRMTEKIPGELIRIEASDRSPFGFTFWLQMKQVAPAESSENPGNAAGQPEGRADAGTDGMPDTRIRLVLHAEMNMVIKMMVGGKIQPALDGMVDQIAASFNAI